MWMTGGATHEKVNDFDDAVNPIPFCSRIANHTRTQLWTTSALAVDGFKGRLRGFRKSHHLIPARPPRSDGLRDGSGARSSESPGPEQCVSRQL
jgi:hypothetical protein